MGWLAPLSRREIALILFSLSIFTFTYNLETSFRYLGINPADSQAVFGRLGLGQYNTIQKDGRKLSKYRDKVESKIYGNWAWDSGYVAGDSVDRSQELSGPHSAMWLGRQEVGDITGGRLGEHTVDDGFRRWENDIPHTKLLKHVPGMG